MHMNDTTLDSVVLRNTFGEPKKLVCTLLLAEEVQNAE
jgi:hypothetical protein